MVFDLDGTVLDTIYDLYVSMNYSLSVYHLQKRTLEEVTAFVGNGIHRLCELAVPSGTDSETLEKVFCTFNEHYAVHCNDTTKPYDKIIEALNGLKSKGYKLAVVSNKSDYAVKTLCDIYFKGIFDYRIGSRDGVRKKPYPDSVLSAMEKLGASKETTVYVGDSEVDVATAKNAGIDCISVSWGFRKRAILEELNPDNIADTVEQMISMIEK